MLFNLKQTFCIIVILFTVAACQSKKQMTSMEKSTQYKERINKKKREEYKRSRERAKEKHYNKQSAGAKRRWDYNQSESENWRKQEFHNKSLKYRIRKFFELFQREPKPDEGLFNKRQMRRRKGNFFKRVLKKIKRNK